MLSRELAQDYYSPSKEAPRRDTISPRVILLDEKHNFVLVVHQETGWRGLPGGKVKVGESLGEGNFLSTGAFETLKREVSEEVGGIDISPYLPSQSACLGITEIFAVDSNVRQITRIVSPIFVCKVPDLSGVTNEGTLVTPAPFPGPLFPDARIALGYFFKRVKAREWGPIYPEFLNEGAVYYFQMRPNPQLLLGRPSWA